MSLGRLTSYCCNPSMRYEVREPVFNVNKKINEKLTTLCLIWNQLFESRFKRTYHWIWRRKSPQIIWQRCTRNRRGDVWQRCETFQLCWPSLRGWTCEDFNRGLPPSPRQIDVRKERLHQEQSRSCSKAAASGTSEWSATLNKIKFSKSPNLVSPLPNYCNLQLFRCYLFVAFYNTSLKLAMFYHRLIKPKDIGPNVHLPRWHLLLE